MTSTATPATTAAPETSPPTTATTTTTAVSTTTTLPASGNEWPLPDGVDVAVAAADGLHVLSGSDDRIVDPGSYSKVVADPSGDGWFVEVAGVEGSPEIRRIGDDGSSESIVAAEDGTHLQLHDAGVVDGDTYLFFNVNLVRRGFGDPDAADALIAMDVTTGTQHKVMDLGGWEARGDVRFGGGVLVGTWTSNAIVEVFSVDLEGRPDPVDVQSAGLLTSYADDPAAPHAVTISPDGSQLSWVTPTTNADGNVVDQRVTVAGIDGSDRRDFTLPAGPGQGGLVDHGDFLVDDAYYFTDGGFTAAMIVDARTGGMYVLPDYGPAAARGTWEQTPNWPIASPVTEDVTAQIRASEPQWATSPDQPEDNLASLLIAEGGDGECASDARVIYDPRAGDPPFYIELLTPCDDSVAGWWYEVSILGPMPDGSITGGASRRLLCHRGVTADGRCV